ncbi:hypothetical protein [Streptomyces halobius]|uniref:Uncharacterized protein n=1 Tax=Streptomyces halobius TaxID=2879846 RepID=A0ABY4MAW0_9ACTN|nr:hypothetical protein [Streptomyces halobius]UQA94823.1 hypothetical protein K9S39_25835 [Streptomyces halobius]
MVDVLKELDRHTRTMPNRRRRRPAPEAEPVVEVGQAEPPGGVRAAVVVTGEDSRATWTLPAPLDAPPVVTALVEGDGLLLAVLEDATPEAVTVRAWTLVPSRAPAGPGIAVHLTASPGGGARRAVLSW